MVDGSSHEELRDRIDSMLARWHRQAGHLAAARARLQDSTSVASSVDDLVRVTVDAVGIPIEVVVAPEAFSRSSPEVLGRSITEAAQTAARAAQVRAQDLIGPVLAAGRAMPDLPDLVPGAPSLHDLLPLSTTVAPREARSE